MGSKCSCQCVEKDIQTCASCAVDAVDWVKNNDGTLIICYDCLLKILNIAGIKIPTGLTKAEQIATAVVNVANTKK